MKRQHVWATLLLVLAIGYAALTLWTAPAWTVDDAYILFRYARHWVTTGIPVWNPGEPPVEGYTGTLYLALLAAGYSIGLPLEGLAKAIGIAAYGLTGLTLWLLLRDLQLEALVRAWALVLYCTAAFLFTHALSGLETTLFCALLMASVWLCTRGVSIGWTWYRLAAAFAALALLSLVRPEGMLFAAALVAALCLRIPKRQYGYHLRQLPAWIQLRPPPGFWLSLTALLVVLAAVTAWRWHVYGELLPNTYVAKRADGFGLSAILSFLEFGLQYWAIPTLIVLLTGIAEWEEWQRLLRLHGRALAPIAGALAIATLVMLVEYSRSTLQMNYSHRFWAMLYPLGLAAAAVGSHYALRAVGATAAVRPLRYRRLRHLVCALLLLQCAVHGGLWRWQERKFVRDYQQLLQEEHAVAAELLLRLLPPQALIMVYPDAGLIPYRTGFPTLDGGRLNDRFLARHRWSGTPRDSVILNYIFARRPAAFVFKSRRDDRLRLNPEAEAIVDDPRFAPYVLVATLRTRAKRFAESYFLLVYVHRDFAQSTAQLSPTRTWVTTAAPNSRGALQHRQGWAPLEATGCACIGGTMSTDALRTAACVASCTQGLVLP